jgi:hypothetical protein
MVNNKKEPTKTVGMLLTIVIICHGIKADVQGNFSFPFFHLSVVQKKIFLLKTDAALLFFSNQVINTSLL